MFLQKGLTNILDIFTAKVEVCHKIENVPLNKHKHHAAQTNWNCRIFDTDVIWMFFTKLIWRMVETITMNPSNLNEIITLQTRSGISEAMSFQLFYGFY